MTRSPERGLAVLAIAATLAAALAAQAPASLVDQYAAAVRTYVDSGDAVKAVTPLRTWAQPDFDAAIDGQIVRRDPRLDEAAAVLHLEIGLGVVLQSTPSAAAYLELGERIVRNLRALPPRLLHVPQAEIAAFSEKWYAVAASTFLLINDVAAAAPFVSRGLRVAPASPELRLLEGMISEMRAVSLDPDDWETLTRQARIRRERTLLLLKTEGTYRRILADAPSFTPARVRLGRVLSLLGHSAQALTELRRAEQEAQEPSHRYLAAMFVGAVLEQQGDREGARASYQRALAIQPSSQAATVALGYLHLLNGRPDQAQALARGFMAQGSAADGDEWWAYRNGGLERPALTWLRQRVQR